MAKYRHTHLFEYPWEHVTQAVWQKYPNPFSSHVLSADVIDRYVDENTGMLYTTRLLLKRGVIPQWGRALLRVQEAYVVEHSVVDPRTRTMRTVTRNVNHRKILLVEEYQRISPAPIDPTNPNRAPSTIVAITNRLVSNYGWSAIRSRIENFGIATAKSHARDSSQALLHAIERLSAVKTSS